MKRVRSVVLGALVGLLSAGCASTELPRSGFLSDYSRLKPETNEKMRYVSPELKNYDRYIVDPVELHPHEDEEVLTDEQRAEVAVYLRDAFRSVLTGAGLTVVDTAGVNVARVRMAITQIHETKWYLNIHPGSKLTGAGTGGATMEAEVIDSVTGRQLAAVLQRGRASQFSLNAFSTLDDVKSVIDEWAKQATARLKELRGAVDAPK